MVASYLSLHVARNVRTDCFFFKVVVGFNIDRKRHLGLPFIIYTSPGWEKQNLVAEISLPRREPCFFSENRGAEFYQANEEVPRSGVSVTTFSLYIFTLYSR